MSAARPRLPRWLFCDSDSDLERRYHVSSAPAAARRPAPSSAAGTRCAPRSATAAWARSGGPPTPCCAATSRSRRSCCRRAWRPATATRCTSARCARPAPPPPCSTPRWCRSTTWCTEGGRPWIVMELLDARSLADMVIEDGPLAAARGRQDRHRAARRARGRARRRRAAPRREAGQRADLLRRPLRAHRLRRRPDAHRRAAHHARHGARLAALHLARARDGQRVRPAQRPVLARRDALHRGRGPAAVRQGRPDRDHARGGRGPARADRSAAAR